MYRLPAGSMLFYNTLRVEFGDSLGDKSSLFAPHAHP